MKKRIINKILSISTMIISVLEKPLLLYQVYSWNLKKAHFKKNREISSHIIRIETEKDPEEQTKHSCDNSYIIWPIYYHETHYKTHIVYHVSLFQKTLFYRRGRRQINILVLTFFKSEMNKVKLSPPLRNGTVTVQVLLD